MKQNFFKVALFALCLGTAFSCTKEIAENGGFQRQAVTFHAYDAESNDLTKTTLSGTSVLWNPGDEIMVYQGTKSSGKFTATATEVCASTDFTGTLPYIIGSQEASAEASNIWAVYPYSAACGCDGSSVTIKVDAEQTAQEGTFASGLFPSVAKSNAYSLAFYNVCGGVKFTVAQEGIKKVVLKGNNSENLAGRVNVSFDGGLPEINSIEEPVDSIVVNAPDVSGFTPGEAYYIVAIPTEFTNGFSMSFSTKYDTTEFLSSSFIKIKRRTFGVLLEKDKEGILFRDSNAKQACMNKFDSNHDGNVSFDEAAIPSTLSGLFEGYEGVQYFPELIYFISVKDLKECFVNCTYLKEISIPSHITTIGSKSFYGCNSLSAINVPSTISAIGSEAFRNCKSLSLIELEEGVESLGNRAFYNTAATTVKLPASITSIGSRAFGNEMLKIRMSGLTPPQISEISFGTATLIYVPNEALSTYKTSENWCEIEEYIFPFEGNDLSSFGTANCYIVNKAGNFKFKATVKGCGTESVGIPASATILWESFGTEATPNVGDIIRNATYNDGYVEFSTPDTLKNGNALIAVKDDSGNILWSWHLWVYDQFDPLKMAQVYNNNAGIMMDRNLGATSNSKGDKAAIGLSYQWGRKDPFLQYGTSTITWPSSVVSTTITGTIEYSISHPTTSIHGDGSFNFDWLYREKGAPYDTTRWHRLNQEKSIYDPCPYGWRLPEGDKNGIWAKAFGQEDTWITESNWDSINLGMDFGITDITLGSGTIWYPAYGNVNYIRACTACGLSFNRVGYVIPSTSPFRHDSYPTRCMLAD